MILRVSSQGQVSLPRALREALQHPTHMEAVLEAPDRLVLTPCMQMTVAEAALRFGRHGITQDVLMEALKLVERRREEAAKAGPAP